MRNAGLIIVPALITLFASLFASSHPDALERVAINFGFDEKAKEAASVFTDYTVSFINNETVSTFLAGIAGLVLLYALYKAAAFAVSKFAK
jgi:hypothetical protein